MSPENQTSPEVHPAVVVLLAELDVIAAEGRHAADPREPSERLARALTAYFRSPD